MGKTDTKNELRGEVERLESEVARLKKGVKSKKFGLVWIHKEKSTVSGCEQNNENSV